MRKLTPAGTAKPWAGKAFSFASALPLATAVLPNGQRRLETLSSLIAGISPSDANSETLLAQKIQQLDVSPAVDDYESRWLARLRDLSTLRALVFGRQMPGKHGLRQGFAYARTPVRMAAEAKRYAAPTKHSGSSPSRGESPSQGTSAADVGAVPSLQDITESATVVADLYWKLYRTCAGEFPELAKVAHKLYEAVFQERYHEAAARLKIAHLSDAMQRDHGIPFLLLNLLRQGRECTAKEVSQILLIGESQLDEEIRTPLYWMSEIFWFAQSESPLSDYDATVRHLYHLCFTNPDRAGFLEIDSQFFPEFEMISEIAHEAFVFRETLLDWILGLWRDYEGLLDSPFQRVLESMTRGACKIHDNRPSWERFWNLEREQFSCDYLQVAEGNLAYAAGHYRDAAECYARALEISPALRAARLNHLFCLAQLGFSEDLSEQAALIAGDASLGAAALYASGNALVLGGRTEEADACFAQLRQLPGWERKTDYYRSTFLFAQTRFAEALAFARSAAAENPHDAGIQYHLSLCYNALGEKGEALKTLQRVPVAVPPVEWLDYYRFTLERDAGHHAEASQTLRRIPREYFRDEQELEDALRFARGQQDLTLLRHLKRRD